MATLPYRQIQLTLQHYVSEFVVNNLRLVVDAFWSNKSSDISAGEERLIDLCRDLIFSTLFTKHEGWGELRQPASKSYSIIGAKAIPLTYASSWLYEQTIVIYDCIEFNSIDRK